MNASMATSSRKRKFLSLEEKARIISAASSGRKKGDVAADFGISQSTLSTILKSKDAIAQALSSGTSAKRKKLTQAAHEDLEKALYTWFLDVRAKKMPVSGNMLQQKALGYACMLGINDFKASSGWLTRFKARHEIVAKVLCGESASSDADAASAWASATVPELMEKYATSDIYNADETGLFFELLPSKTLHMKGQPCSGGKHSKKRVTVLLCCNMDGSEKRCPLVIGRSAKPRCFKGGKSLPVKYVANKKSWMTGAVFKEWLTAFDRDMTAKKRKVCLLIDNCSAHNVEDVQLQSVEVRFFPPNCTALIQPLDQGIINSVKSAYRQRLIQRLVLNIDTGRAIEVDLYMAVQMVSAAWTATSRSIIYNCFVHAGFHSDAQLAANSTSDEEGCSTIAPPSTEANAAWAALQDSGDVPADVHIGDYIAVDSEVLAHEELSDEAIIEGVRHNDASSDDDSDAEDLAPPPAIKVMDAFDVIRRFFGAHDDDVAMQLFTECESRATALVAKKKKQKKLTDFFGNK
ncbi:tigger transposable element-derived protein 6-like [Dermacentor albipictus]|uniref:tigger transposable element-derived protein 6-like n=1 Tax=Dermacentor albipictus TaxID=60249 RepID=UPI0038FCC99C